MDFKFILGVDISKDWFNFCLKDHSFNIISEGEVINSPDPVLAFLSHFIQQHNLEDLSQVILVLEHTGIYVHHLVRAWLSKSGRLSMVAATKVSDLLGGKTQWDEKTDQLDARRLAEYGIRYSDKLILWQAPSHLLVQLQAFHRQRRRLTDAINLLQTPLNESKLFDTLAISNRLEENQSAGVTALKADLKNLEKKIMLLIQNDPHLNNLFSLITSVQGIGPVTAREIIITTSAFTDFLPNQAKAFARYAGVVPISRQSGKVNKRKRISNRGNKKLKSLLTMAAMSLISCQSDLGLYYQRKREEGKAHLSIVNAMRNKLILRIFAVVRNQVMYEKNRNISLN